MGELESEQDGWPSKERGKGKGGGEQEKQMGILDGCRVGVYPTLCWHFPAGSTSEHQHQDTVF